MWRLVLVVVVVLVACSSKKAPPEPACTTDGDCAIWCGPNDCCPHACTTATTRRAMESVQAEAHACSQDDVAACPPGKVLPAIARCRAGACVAETHTPPPVTAIDARGYKTACAVDADCTLVETDRCSPCRCANVPIAATERGRYQAAFDATTCVEQGRAIEISITSCVHCDAMVPSCNMGTCTAKSVEPAAAGGECSSDADCVVSCAVAGTCCEPDGCETVIAKRRADEIVTANRPSCPDLSKACPTVTPSPRVVPRCKAGTCFAEVRPR